MPKRKRGGEHDSIVGPASIGFVIAAVVAATSHLSQSDDESEPEESHKEFVIPRVRTSIEHIHRQLSDYHFRRAYRMTYKRALLRSLHLLLLGQRLNTSRPA